MEIISKYRFAKSSSQKLRLIVKSIKKEEKIQNIIDLLYFINKKTAFIINKALISAIFNAKHNFNINIDNLKIKEILINNGPSFKKIFPRAKGRINYIKKRTSHVTIKLIRI